MPNSGHGIRALLLPETPATQALPAADPEAVQRLREDLRGLLDEVRRAPPAEDGADERAALLRLSLLGLSSLQLIGSRTFVESLRDRVNDALQDLMRQELAAADPERKLALRHLEQAVHRYGVLMESAAASLTGLSPSTLELLRGELVEQAKAGTFVMNDAERVVARFQLDVLVALHVLDGPLEALTFWSFRAITGARRVEALTGGAVPSSLRGELARLRSRTAWADWDEAEIEKELAPWPDPPP